MRIVDDEFRVFAQLELDVHADDVAQPIDHFAGFPTPRSAFS